MYLTYYEKINRQIEALRQISNECRLAQEFYKKAVSKVASADLRDNFHHLRQDHCNIEQELNSEIQALGNWMDLMRSQVVKSSLTDSEIPEPHVDGSERSWLTAAVQMEKALLDEFGRTLEWADPKSSTFVTLISLRNKTRAAIKRLNKLLPASTVGSK